MFSVGSQFQILNLMMCSQMCLENFTFHHQTDINHSSNTFNVGTFVDKRCKHPIKEIQVAVVGAICQEQAAKLKIYLNSIDEQKNCIT